MKHILITLVFLCGLSGYGLSQNLEYHLSLTSGLFNFTGESAEAEERINYNLVDEDGYTNNPFGSKRGLCYGLGFKVNQVSTSNFVYGVEIAYEVLRSKVEIIGIYQYDELKNTTIDASGQTYFNHHFINVYPHIGQQISTPNFIFEFSGGLDLGFGINAWENGFAETIEREYKTNRERGTVTLDIRPHLQLGIILSRITAYVGYSKGIINYKADYVGGTNTAFSNLVRFGLSYRLK